LLALALLLGFSSGYFSQVPPSRKTNIFKVHVIFLEAEKRGLAWKTARSDEASSLTIVIYFSSPTKSKQ